MSIAQHIKITLELPTSVAESYIADLTDEQLMLRPHESANHIKWQLGHLITAENNLGNAVRPGSMPELPEGFAEKHSKETASVDDPSAFASKEEYLELMKQQRAATIALAESLSDEELLAPAPENLQHLAKTMGALLQLNGSHAMMHGGQWVVVRRQLGKEALF